ncbi:MAG: trypsin-like peptidase domain-containing protein [Rhodospirillaceae bacterium]
MLCIAPGLTVADAYAQTGTPDGRTLAATWCSACHQVSPAAPENPAALSFMEMAEQPYLTKRFIFDWIAGNRHPVMPAFNLSPDQRDSIASYIVALKHPETAIPSLQEIAPGMGTERGTGVSRRSATMDIGSSTGFYVSPDGYLVTSAHGVRGCARVTVLRDGRRSIAALVGMDEQTDIALMKGEPTRDIVFLGSGADISEGLSVTSFGFPLPSVLSTDGVMGFGQVNAMRGALDNREKMQVNIPAYPGSSGSPVFDGSGRVVGMITGRINRALLAVKDHHYVDSITFAAKVSAIRDLLRQHSVDGLRGRATGPSVAAAREATVRMLCEHRPS